MKRILITGKNSYIGTSVENWLNHSEDKYEISTIDMHGDSWKQHDFSQYDVVFHVAGIAHQKETRKNRHLYYEVNRDLAYETAKKAKAEGISQFIFLSSMSVYGMNTGVITKDTVEKPKTAYGKSKLEAERLILPLETEEFKIVILRPPMIYGPGCKGNYKKLSNFSKKFPIFPEFKNKRSMLFIDNLSILISELINVSAKGLFLPQNTDYVSTSDLVREIAAVHNKSLFLTKAFNPLINILTNTMVFSKVFGDLIYDKKISTIRSNFIVFEKSIEITENG